MINVSSVACLPTEEESDDRALGAALAYAVDVKNVVVVAAAGNIGAAGQCAEQNPTPIRAGPAVPDWSDVNTVVTPGWYDDYVLTVGSVGRDGAPSPFSLAGPWVDVAAPGEGIVSLDPDGEGLIDRLTAAGDERPISGTSYAAPVVSGIVALLRSRAPELTARQVMQRIEDTAHGPSGRLGSRCRPRHGRRGRSGDVQARGRTAPEAHRRPLPMPGAEPADPGRPLCDARGRGLRRGVDRGWLQRQRRRRGYDVAPTLSRTTDAPGH